MPGLFHSSAATTMESDEEEITFYVWVDEDLLDTSGLQTSFDKSVNLTVRCAYYDTRGYTIIDSLI